MKRSLRLNVVKSMRGRNALLLYTADKNINTHTPQCTMGQDKPSPTLNPLPTTLASFSYAVLTSRRFLLREQARSDSAALREGSRVTFSLRRLLRWVLMMVMPEVKVWRRVCTAEWNSPILFVGLALTKRIGCWIGK